MEDRDGQDCGLMIEMIRAGALAGVYSALSRELPGHEGGFEKLRLKHHRFAAWLMDELIAAPGGLESPGAASMSARHRQGRA